MRTRDYSMELFFKALADRTRLRLINLIGDDEVCVCVLVQVFRTNQPKVSRHLAYLRKAGLVSSRKEGKWMNYSLVEPRDLHAAKIFRALRHALAQNSEMRQDRDRFERICADSRLQSQLDRAQRPVSMSV